MQPSLQHNLLFSWTASIYTAAVTRILAQLPLALLARERGLIVTRAFTRRISDITMLHSITFCEPGQAEITFASKLHLSRATNEEA